MSDTDDALPRIEAPIVWPTDIEPLSFSSWQTLRVCPRRWAYTRATFLAGGLTDARGRLERRVSAGSIAGDVTHAALARLLDLHTTHGGPPVGSWALPRFWREHLPNGGLHALVTEMARAAIGRLPETGRHRLRTLRVGEQVMAEIPAMLNYVHQRVGLLLTEAPGMTLRTEFSTDEEGPRGALGEGAWSEVKAVATLGASSPRQWIGVIDAVRIARDTVTLIDWKTGAPDASHRAQLELYALLFARDVTLNPRGVRPTRLLLAYRDGKADAWPGPEESALAVLEAKLEREARAAEAALSEVPAEARPSIEACEGCPARLVCDAHWITAPKSRGRSQAFSATRVSLELAVERVSSGSDEVQGKVRACGVGTAVGQGPIRLLLHAGLRAGAARLEPGERLRVLDAEPGRPEHEGTTDTEVWWLGPQGDLALCGSK